MDQSHFHKFDTVSYHIELCKKVNKNVLKVDHTNFSLTARIYQSNHKPCRHAFSMLNAIICLKVNIKNVRNSLLMKTRN